MANMEELKDIMEKFVGTDWDLIALSGPAMAGWNTNG